MDSDLAPAAPCDSDISTKKNGDGLGLSNSAVSNCQYCSHPFLETELQMHILNCPSKEFNIKSDLMNEINSSVLISENQCTKSLPDVVPEQDSLFQKESLHSDLPHTKTFMNVDVKNLDEIEANADFSTCLDLINNNKELERMVQGIDSLDQIDNNYLPYITPADSSDNFLTSNLCNEIQKDISETPVHNEVFPEKNDEFNTYTVNCASPQLQGNKSDVNTPFNSEIEFAEKEYELCKSDQKIFPKPEMSYVEKISVSSSKASDDYAFSALAEVLKVTHCQNEYESIDTCLKNSEQNASHTFENQKNASQAFENRKGTSHAFENQKNASHKFVNQKGTSHAFESQNGTFHKVESNKNVSYAVTNLQKVASPKFSCPHCSKKLSSAGSVKKHIVKIHSHLFNDTERNLSPKLTDISSPVNISDCKFQFENDGNSGSGTSYNDSNNSVYHILQPDGKHDPAMQNNTEINVLPKGRIKGIVKGKKIECKYCGKSLTSVYMKKHILNQHQEISRKLENSSDLNADINQTPILPVDSVNVSAVSPLLEQDIDSSTCLSMSDALKRNISYTVTEASEGSRKIAENVDVKFNFNVLEFSKDTKIDSKLFDSAENLTVKLESSPTSSPVHNFEVKKVVSDVTYSKQTEHLVQGPSCHLCGKLYNSISALYRHLRVVHGITTDKTKRNKIINKVTQAKNVKLEQNQPKTNRNLQEVAATNVGAVNVSNNKTSVHIPKEVTHMENMSSSTSSFIPHTKERYKSLMNKESLLRTVLQSNFVKDCRESREIVGVNNSRLDKKINCDISKISESSPRLHSSVYNTNRFLATNTIESSNDPGLKLGDKISTLVPSENLPEIQKSVNSEGSLHELIPNTNNHYHSSLSSKFADNLLNDEMCGSGGNSEIKYSNMADSQNSSIQSSEISPISEIISNVSKCHFGGTSNNDNKKEVFEDNSLKLLIPKNNEESANGANVYQSSICGEYSKISDDQNNRLEGCSNVIDDQSNKVEDCSNISDDQSNKLEDCSNVSDDQSNKLEDCSNVSDDQSNKIEDCSNVSDDQSNKIEDCSNVSDDQSNKLEDCSNVSDDQSNKIEDCSKPNEEHCNILYDKPKNNDESASNANDYGSSICDEYSRVYDQSNILENYSNISSDQNNEHKDYGEKIDEQYNLYDEPCCASNKQDVLNSCNIKIKQEFLQEKEKCTGISEESSMSLQEMYEVSAVHCVNSEKILESKSSELEDSINNVEKNSVRCRLCHQNLDSMEILSKHLKEVHDIPVLKKHVSEPPSPEKSLYSEEPGKLSPPKLKLGTNESDSESVSDFDNSCSLSKTASDSSELDRSKNKLFSEDNSCALHRPPLKPSEQDREAGNFPSRSFKKVKHSKKDIEASHNSSSIHPQNQPFSNLEYHPQSLTSPVCKYKVRRHSFGGVCSVSSEECNPSDHNNEYLSFDLNTFCKSKKQESVSLPNLKIRLQRIIDSQTEYKSYSTKTLVKKKKHIESSSEENTSFSSVTDNTEICKSPCDSLSSQNNSVAWNKITVNSSFILPKPLNSPVPKMSHKGTILRSKLAAGKLIIQRLKTYEKQKKIKKKTKSGFHCHRKFKTKKTYKPIILTLKEATEIQKFLETHKQPIVKLIHLKENESGCLLDRNSDKSISKYDMKEAVVKLERMHIPNNIDKVVLINQDFFVPNLLPQDAYSSSLSMQNHEDGSMNCPDNLYVDSNTGNISPAASVVHGPPEESAELPDCLELSSSSSDSVQFLGTVTRETKARTKTEFCTTPSTKKCFVVLKRISV